jgi:hypothetical protein
MSTKPTKPGLAATPEVVVENLRAAVYASHEEISVQVQADGGLDSKLLGLLGFFVAVAGILLTVPHGLDPGRQLLLAGAGFGALVCLAAIVGGSIPSAGPRASEFYDRYGTNAEVGYQTQLLADVTSVTMPSMNTKPPPLPPPSDVPRSEIPTGGGGTLGLQELWTLLRRLLHRS